MCEAVVRSASRSGCSPRWCRTILGTLVAFALVRHSFRGPLVDQPADLPADGDARDRDGLLAAGAVRVGPGFAGQLGFWTILIAHIMFCLSFVVVTVRARLAGMDDNLEQAAMDLYATPRQTFWRVTFPLVFPGILGAALLAFSLSFDDFIVTNLNAGTTTTFPMYVWGVAQRGVPMQVNVVGTLMFVIAIASCSAASCARRRTSTRRPSCDAPTTITRTGARRPWQGGGERYGDVYDPATGRVSGRVGVRLRRRGRRRRRRGSRRPAGRGRPSR